MKYEVAENRDCPGEWLAEAIDDEGSGSIFTVAFSGPGSEKLAREYAAWKNKESVK